MHETRETQEIREAKPRAVVMSACLEIMRMLAIEYHRTPMFGSNSDEVVLRAAVFIGQADGKRMNVSKLAEYAGIPRPSAIRKLNSMARRGILRKDTGGYYVPASVANSPDMMRVARKLRRIIMRACDRLAELGGELAE